jgi:uncharacterized DUF497 family protein
MNHDPDFEWDEETHVLKVEAHGVTPTEAEDAILDPNAVPAQARSTPSEKRRGMIGMTEAGRINVVIYTIRHNAIRVITAFDASEIQKRRYRR